MQPVVNVCAPNWQPEDSYGRLALELARGMEQHGVHVNYFGFNPPPNKRIVPAFGGICLGYPTIYEKYGPLVQRGPKLAVTMFESTTLPDGWVEVLNRCHLVVVPSTANGQWFYDNGVRSSLAVLPLGVSEAFQYQWRPEKPPVTRFLAIADRGRRKGWHLAGFAFNYAFGDRQDVELVLKCRKDGLPFVMGNPNMSLIAEDYSDEQMNTLYGTCDYMIFPTAGEGFGLPPREFAATGGIAIATAFGGTFDELYKWGIPIHDYRRVLAWKGDKDWHGKLGEWAEVDVEGLARILRRLVDQPAYTNQDRQRVSEYVRNQYQWQKFTRSILQFWQRIESEWYAPNSARSEKFPA